MKLPRIFGPIVVLFGVVACSNQPTSPRGPSTPSFIINGTPTGDAYASVGAMLFDVNGDGEITGNDVECSGSLIGATVFLTAAHCVAFAPPGTHFYVSFSPDLYAQSFSYIAATGAVFDPQFGHGQENLHDLALVFLPPGATNGLTPLRLPPAGLLDALAAKGGLTDQLFLNVGYGTSATLTGQPGYPYDGVRKVSQSAFMGLRPTWLGLLMNSHATGLGGDCFHDSGGPKFLDGNPDMIVATVSTGDRPCRATSWDWRLDTQEARGFLGQYVTLP
jgi:hypothetical protein